jgi:hypothetical protein
VFTTKRELIAFEAGDSGKTAYFAVRTGNGNNEYGQGRQAAGLRHSGKTLLRCLKDGLWFF